MIRKRVFKLRKQRLNNKDKAKMNYYYKEKQRNNNSKINRDIIINVEYNDIKKV